MLWTESGCWIRSRARSIRNEPRQFLSSQLPHASYSICNNLTTLFLPMALLLREKSKVSRLIGGMRPNARTVDGSGFVRAI